MLTEKDYCDYETCVALKKLGYNEKSNWWFSKYLNEDSGQMELVYICDNPAHLNYDSWGIVPKDFVIRPSLYEAQKWLREEKDMNVYVKAFNGEGWFYIIQNCNGVRICPPLARIVVLCHSYEEALCEGIKKAIEILKER